MLCVDIDMTTIKGIDMQEPYLRKNIETYERDFDPMSETINQMTYYISKKLDVDTKRAREIVGETLRESSMRNPVVTYYHRGENGDKEIKKTPLTKYIQDSLDKGEIIVPSFTTYTSEKTKKSLHGTFITKGLNKRVEKKTSAKKALAVGDIAKFKTDNIMQKAFKLKNNAVSGMYGSQGTLYFNASAHYSLTSTTRISASIGNMVTESMVAGNRLYRSPDHVLQHMTAVCVNIDMKELDSVLREFNIIDPTVEDVMSMVCKSTGYYWIDDIAINRIKGFVTKLEPIERSAVLYVNDLYHLKEVNREIIFNILDALAEEKVGISDDISILNDTEEYLINIVHHITSTDLKGKGINYSKMSYELKDTLVSTTINLKEQMDKYHKLFKTLFTTEVMPIDIAYMDIMTRKAIALSDTDSTCGSYHEWVSDRFGDKVFSRQATSLSAVVLLFNSEAIGHFLHQLSANMNASKDKYKYLAMKNEFYWYTINPMDVSKHYFADVGIKEGLVFKDNDDETKEVKGVNLIATNIPVEFKNKLTDLMDYIRNTPKENVKINLDKIVKDVANMERDIETRLRTGDTSLLKIEKIKDEKGYKESWHKSNYWHYKFYDECLSDKYGKADEAPITCRKIPTTLSKAKDIVDFIDNIVDEDIRTKVREFLKKSPKNSLEIFRLPINIIQHKGVPEEMLKVLNAKRVIADCLAPFYMVINSLGFYKKEGYTLTDMGY